YEDVDWAFRAQLLGYGCRYVPTAVVYHHGSATLGRGFTEFNGYHQWRNSVWLIVKCVPLSLLLRHGPVLAYGQVCNLLDAARTGLLHVWAQAARDALRGLPRALAQRRQIQRRRVVSSGQLEAVTRLGKQ
ncbi:MAG: glycosyltransferase family 2 protein, partial [Solirubrobacteraceae bacterium]